MKYYVRLTILLGLVYGFIGVQRIVIGVIMPTIQEDMKFTYTDVGLIMAVTGLLWAFGAVIWAALGDRLGRRPVIAVTTILAAVFSWITGLVTSIGQMLVVRGILGFFEGGPWSPSMATASEEAPEKNRGFVMAFIPACFALIGGVAGPIAAVAILGAYGSWRYVFYVLSIPAAVIGIITLFAMREPPSIAEKINKRKMGKKELVDGHGGRKVSLSDVLKYKNVLVSILMSIPVMGWLWTTQAFAPLFFTKVHSIGMEQIGIIMAFHGLGGFVGMPGSGVLSDGIGRKTAMIIFGLLSSCVGVVFCLLPIGVNPIAIYVCVFFWGFFTAGAIPLYLGALITESVPDEVAGTAVSVPTSVGEILGAAVIPVIAGAMADSFSIYAPMWMAAAAGLVIACISLIYVETAPRKVAKMTTKPTHNDYLLKPFRVSGGSDTPL
jgi:MFS family permease